MNVDYFIFTLGTKIVLASEEYYKCYKLNHLCGLYILIDQYMPGQSLNCVISLLNYIFINKIPS